MYRGFIIENFHQYKDEEALEVGREIQNNKKLQIKENFKKYLIDNETLDANFVMDKWFPKGDYHIFLSHSHKDLDLALTIAGKLQIKHNLNVFVDSSVWLNSNDLLKLIDDEFCKNSEGTFYDYERRNYSTAHVHMMLMNSLNTMIDNSESLFFLNTPNSASAKETIKSRTFSPWIYSELETSKIINKKTPLRLFRKTKYFSKTENKMTALNESMSRDLQVSYELELSHLKKISVNSFISWMNSYSTSAEGALDELYKLQKLDNIYINY